MKKLMAMVCALVMALGCSAAFAEETANVVNWEDVKAAVDEIPGGYVTLDLVGLQMWMPDVITQDEVPDEYAEQQGMIYCFTTADSKAGVTVCLLGLTEGNTMEDYKTAMIAAGATEAEEGVVNGLKVFIYKLEETDSAHVVYQYSDDYLLIFNYAPVSDTGFFTTAQLMMASVMEYAEVEQ